MVELSKPIAKNYRDIFSYCDALEKYIEYLEREILMLRRP